MSITFTPTTSGTRTATLSVTDNAPGSPQTAPLTGTGTGTPPPLAIDTQFFTCSGGVCDIGAGSNVFVSNFFTTSFEATGAIPIQLVRATSGRVDAAALRAPARCANHDRDADVHRD